MQAETQTQTEPSYPLKFFGKRGSWVSFGINELLDAVATLFERERDFTVIRQKFEELTNCEYQYDGESYTEELAKLSNTSLIKEYAVDKAICYFDKFEVEFEIYLTRLVMIVANEEWNVPQSPSTLKLIAVNIKALHEDEGE